MRDRSFRSDLDPLLANTPLGYDVDAAATRVITELLSRIDSGTAHQEGR